MRSFFVEKRPQVADTSNRGSPTNSNPGQDDGTGTGGSLGRILYDLNRILRLRGRLQELGCSFTPEGELLTYGNPLGNAELHQMLHLGSKYDQLWKIFFKGIYGNSIEDNLWPELHTLKRALKNKGVQFDRYHKRLNYSTSYQELVRLSFHYDLMYAERFQKTLQNVHPAFRPGFSADQVPITAMNLGWGSLRDSDREDQLVHKMDRLSNELPVVDEEQPSVQRGIGPAVSETDVDHQSPPAPSEFLINTRDMKFVADVDPVPPTQSSRVAAGAPPLLHASSLLQGWKDKHEEVLAAWAGDEQKIDEEQEFTGDGESKEFPRASKTRNAKKRRSLSFWLKSVFRLKVKEHGWF
ncbi:hypothetical protein SVAN01_05445 [Stagonosporopsis vannaccii]|nr:hypothetical protein SVAN01_05445 [Stagonosporopsis vannaccii]